MPTHRFCATAVIRAHAERVYAIVADYQHGHQSILPRPPFESLDVEQGGTGAGTVIRCRMRLLGRTREFRAAITEPEPGRVLVETDLATGTVTTFTVAPRNNGDGTEATIATEIPAHGGVVGALERFLIPRLLRPVYVRELARLAEVAESP